VSIKISINSKSCTYSIHSMCSKCPPFAATQAWRHLGHFYTFQQDGATAHRMQETVELPMWELPYFIPPSLWLPNSLDLNPVDYTVWSVLQEGVYREKIRTMEQLQQCIMEEWKRVDQRRVSSTVQWSSGVSASMLVSLQTADILNICCECCAAFAVNAAEFYCHINRCFALK